MWEGNPLPWKQLEHSAVSLEVYSLTPEWN